MERMVANTEALKAAMLDMKSVLESSDRLNACYTQYVDEQKAKGEEVMEPAAWIARRSSENIQLAMQKVMDVGTTLQSGAESFVKKRKCASTHQRGDETPDASTGSAANSV